LQDVSLKIVDIELFRHVKLLDVELRVFLLRWLRYTGLILCRCIFTREFTLAESFIVWDAIFLEYCENPENNQLNLIDCIALSMMSFVRQQVLDQEETS
jgi:TBC1 domain family protein 5